MRILIVMGGFFPGKKYGGPPVSVDNFCSLMSDCDCYIVTHNHDMGESIPYEGITEGKWIDRGNCKAIYLSNEDYCKHQFEAVINDIKPDIIYLQGLFQPCILPCLELAKKYKIKVLLAPRGELCAGAFKKKYKKILYIVYLKIKGLFRNVSFQSTSDEETETIQKYLGADKNRIHFLTNIPSIPRQVYEHPVKEAGKASFVFLSRIHPKKNLLSALKYFSRVTGEVCFDIYGPIEDGQYWDECQRAKRELPENIKVNYCGLVSHDEVHQVFSRYNSFLFPTFSENFGHVVAEALAVGTPVIISDQTPWNDVCEAGAGWAIPLTNTEGFTAAMQTIIDYDAKKFESISSNAYKYEHLHSNRDMLHENYLEALIRSCCLNDII